MAIADSAVAEALTLSFALKRIDDVEARLAAIATRDVRGSSGNRVAQVREQLAWWRAHPEQFVPAEARALERLASFARNGDRTMHGARAAEQPQRLIVENGKKKANGSRRLGWLIGPAKRLGLTLRAMRREAGASHAAGTLVSLKNGHVLALLESQGDRFTAYDAVLNRDPLGIDGGVNLYRYAANNPLGNVDPLGLKITCSSGVDEKRGLQVLPPECEARGADACVGTEYQYDATACQPMKGCPGKFKFDGSVILRIDVFFKKDPNIPYGFDTSKTLGQHENEHVSDYQAFCRAVESAQSEGFTSRRQCERARANWLDWVGQVFNDFSQQSGARDRQ